MFWSQEYVREVVDIHSLAPFTSLAEGSVPDASIVPADPPPVPALSSLAPPHSAHIYIWAENLSQLLPTLWEYEQFVRENAWKWVGDSAADNKDYLKVDERRAMGGVIVRAEVIEVP